MKSNGSLSVLVRSILHEKGEAGFADSQPFAWGGQLTRSLLSSYFILLLYSQSQSVLFTLDCTSSASRSTAGGNKVYRFYLR